jgi:hypothetical protein
MNLYVKSMFGRYFSRGNHNKLIFEAASSDCPGQKHTVVQMPHPTNLSIRMNPDAAKLGKWYIEILHRVPGGFLGIALTKLLHVEGANAEEFKLDKTLTPIRYAVQMRNTELVAQKVNLSKTLPAWAKLALAGGGVSNERDLENFVVRTAKGKENFQNLPSFWAVLLSLYGKCIHYSCYKSVSAVLRILTLFILLMPFSCDNSTLHPQASGPHIKLPWRKIQLSLLENKFELRRWLS